MTSVLTAHCAHFDCRQLCPRAGICAPWRPACCCCPRSQAPVPRTPARLPGPASEPPAVAADGTRESDAREAMCLMIESAATAAGLPLEFFARVIWQESRFRPNAIGPVTRNGQRAQGIAQFMPGTASERGAARPVRPGAGAAQIGRIPGRAARPVRQSGAGSRRLQCRPAPGPGMARRHRTDAAGNPQLRHRHYGLDRRGLGQDGQGRQACRSENRHRAAAT